MQEGYGHYGATQEAVERLIWVVHREPHAVVCGVWFEDRFVSLPRAPFGGWYLLRPISVDMQQAMLKAFKSFLTERGVRMVELYQPPSSYELYAPPVAWPVAIQQAGFRLLQLDNRPHYVVALKGMDTPYCRLHATPLRKIKKLEAAGYHCKHMHWDSKQFIHALSRARSERGYPVLFTEEMAMQVSAHPNRYLVAGCYLGDTMAAMGLLVKVTKEVLYYAQPADFEPFRSSSPLLALQVFLQDWAIREGYHTLDLGPAIDVNGKESPGLKQYKQSVGGTPEMRTFSKWGI